MAVLIDDHLEAFPNSVCLAAGVPSKPVVLRQTLHSDLGGESARITYNLDQHSQVFFQTPPGQVKKIQVTAKVPQAPAGREDSVTLILASGPGPAEVVIKQVIQAETTVRDSVTLAVVAS